jgi:hypothetical protein
MELCKWQLHRLAGNVDQRGEQGGKEFTSGMGRQSLFPETEGDPSMSRATTSEAPWRVPGEGSCSRGGSRIDGVHVTQRAYETCMVAAARAWWSQTSDQAGVGTP